MPSQCGRSQSELSSASKAPSAGSSGGCTPRAGDVDTRAVSTEIADMVSGRLQAELRDTERQLRESMRAEFRGMENKLEALGMKLSNLRETIGEGRQPILRRQQTSSESLDSSSWPLVMPESGREADSRELVQQGYEPVPQLPPGDSSDDDVERATSAGSSSPVPCFDFVVETQPFKWTGLVVILINTGFLLYVTDYSARNLMPRQHWMDQADQAFLAFYTIELLLRLLAKGKKYFGHSAVRYWNMFDLSVVVIGIIDMAFDELSRGEGQSLLAGMVRAARVFKFLRLIRTIHFFDDLKRMSTAVVGSMGLLMFAIAFLVMILMVAALYFVQTMSTFLMEQECDDGPLCVQVPAMFGNVLRSMVVLLQSSTGGVSWGEVYDVLSLAGWFNGALYIAYILFFTFAFFNIVVGIFVDNAIKFAAPSEHVKIQEQKREQQIQIKALRDMLLDVDQDNTGSVSVEELDQAFLDDSMRQRMQILGITARQAKLLLTTLAPDKEKPELSIQVFVDQMVDFIGPASGIDLHRATHDLKEMSLELKSYMQGNRSRSQSHVSQGSRSRSSTQAKTERESDLI